MSRPYIVRRDREYLHCAGAVYCYRLYPSNNGVFWYAFQDFATSCFDWPTIFPHFIVRILNECDVCVKITPDGLYPKLVFRSMAVSPTFVHTPVVVCSNDFNVS